MASLLRTPALLLLACAFACGDSTATSAGESTITTAGPGSSSGATASSGDGTATAGTGTGTSDSDSGSSGPVLDVGAPDGGDLACGCEFNYVWIANSEESTVSKINMDTLKEEARYLTRADGMGNPSRTSVALNGDVAVANRHSGLVKFYADPADCKDTNGVPGIQTSQGKDDVLDWELEECRAWYTDFPATNQRPVAWTPGQLTGPCEATGEMVWTVTSAKQALFPGIGGAGGIIAYLVDGETGAVAKSVEIPTFSGASFGAYGGAVNAHGDLFITSLGPAKTLARVNIDNLAYQVWDMPAELAPYGITVDHNGRVWVSSTFGNPGGARFDPDTETWDLINGFGGGSGLAEGPENLMWISSFNGVNSVDIDTLELGPVFHSNFTIKGVGFDVDGYMWLVNWSDVDEGNQPLTEELVMKVDLGTLMVANAYNGLNRPYTYSDFTGNALFNVTCTPAG
ncbi:MAG: hypothetical protein KC636_10645 [Myxococcales bacterium]|nr:hypothetical protein [Myxococcales bacterium]